MFTKVFRNIMNCLLDCPVFRMFWNFQFISKHSDLFWKTFQKKCSRTFRCKLFPEHSDLFSRFVLFLEYSETFRFVLGTFQKYSGNIQIYFQVISKVFRNIKKFSKVFRNILTYLVDCPIFIIFRNFHKHSDCFGNIFKMFCKTFRLFQNIQICFRDIAEEFRNIKLFF